MDLGLVSGAFLLALALIYNSTNNFIVKTSLLMLIILSYTLTILSNVLGKHYLLFLAFLLFTFLILLAFSIFLLVWRVRKR